MEMILETIRHYAEIGCMLLGAFFILTGSIGVLRFPDFFSRTHAGGMTDSIGLPLILLGLLIGSDFGLITVKIILLIAFAMITSSTASHALARAALEDGIEPLEGEDAMSGDKRK